MALSKEIIKKIIARAIRYKSGDRVVKLKPKDLVAVLGEDEVQNLIPGFDLKELQAAENDRILKELAALVSQEKELRELAEAGVRSALNELKQVQKELGDLRLGKVKGYAVVAIQVDALRDAIGAGEQEEVPELSAEEKATMERKFEEQQRAAEEEAITS